MERVGVGGACATAAALVRQAADDGCVAKRRRRGGGVVCVCVCGGVQATAGVCVFVCMHRGNSSNSSSGRECARGGRWWMEDGGEGEGGCELKRGGEGEQPAVMCGNSRAQAIRRWRGERTCRRVLVEMERFGGHCVRACNS